MKTLCNLAAVFFVVAGWCAHPGVAYAEPGDIVARLGPGSMPQWSPDGGQISLIRADSLFVISADGKSDPMCIGPMPRGGPVWGSSRQLLFSVRSGGKSDSVFFHVASITESKEGRGKPAISDIGTPASVLENRERFEKIWGPITLVDGSPGYLITLGASPYAPGYFVPFDASTLTDREKRLRRIYVRSGTDNLSPGYGDLWSSALVSQTDPGRQLTHDNMYTFIKMAPDCATFIALDISRQTFVVFDTSGTKITDDFESRQVAAANTPHAAAGGMKWAPDSQRLCYIRSYELDEREIDRELVVSNIYENRPQVLMSSEYGMIGLDDYSWSPDGTRIAVATERAGILVVEVSR